MIESIYIKQAHLRLAEQVVDVLKLIAPARNERVQVVKKLFGKCELQVGSKGYPIQCDLDFIPEMVTLARKWESEFGENFLQLTIVTLNHLFQFLRQHKSVYVGTPFVVKEIAVISESGRTNEPFVRVHVGSVMLSLLALGVLADPSQNRAANDGLNGGGIRLYPA